MKHENLCVLKMTQLFSFCLLVFLRFTQLWVRAAIRCQASQK